MKDTDKLKQGNRVLVKNDVWTVSEVVSENRVALERPGEMLECYVDAVSGIIFTIGTDDYFEYETLANGRIKIGPLTFSDEKKLGLLYTSTPSRFVKFLHDLQNLYESETGSPLKLKI